MYLIPFILLAAAFLTACNPVAKPEQNGPAYVIPQDFVRASGRILVVGTNDTPIILHGVCLGNQVWSTPSVPPTTDHDQNDFARLKSWKANVVRFYLNYQIFESDGSPYVYKQDGWNWLDQNIAWAKANGIYIILNMHVPQGGFQSNGDGLALWNNSANQARLKALWKEIARRYQNETQIAGYDLVNEPVVSSSLSQWTDLASQLVSEIRKVDQNHLIIVERLNGVKGNWTTYASLNFFKINDPNIMYTFHFYSPIEYSHQLTSWTGYSNQDGGGYPDQTKIVLPSDTMWYGGSLNNPTAPAGNSSWTSYTGQLYLVTNSKILTGKPVLSSDNNTGVTYFDDIVIKEYNASQVILSNILVTNTRGITGSYWSQNGSGGFGNAAGEGHGGLGCLYITNATSPANISLNDFRFPVTLGHYYSIDGYMKGSSVTGSPRIRVDFEYSPSGTALMHRDKAYLSNELARYIAWGMTNNVPLFVGEFGLYVVNYTNSSKGGTNWLNDFIGLLEDSGVNYTYHSYHETLSFGIYTNNGLPQNNTCLVGVVTALSNIWNK